MKPSVGRIVHFTERMADGPAHLAAIVTQVHNETNVNLAVFDPSGTLYRRTSVSLGTAEQTGTWHWPEREE